MTYLILLFTILAPPAPAKGDTVHRGYTTRYGGGGDGGRALCTGRYTKSTDHAIATRDGKCGDWFVVHNPRNGKWVTVERVDSGPWYAFPISCPHKTVKQEIRCRKKYGRTLVMSEQRARKRGLTFGGNHTDATEEIFHKLGMKPGIGALERWKL